MGQDGTGQGSCLDGSACKVGKALIRGGITYTSHVREQASACDHWAMENQPAAENLA